MKLGGLEMGVTIGAHPSATKKPTKAPALPVKGSATIAPIQHGLDAVFGVRAYDIRVDQYRGVTAPPPSYPRWIYAPTGGAIKVDSDLMRRQFPTYTDSPKRLEDTVMDADEYIASRQNAGRQR